MSRSISFWCLIFGILILCGLTSCEDEGSGIECCTCKCYQPGISGCSDEDDSYVLEVGEDLECADICITVCMQTRRCKLDGSWECTEADKQKYLEGSNDV